MRDVSLGKKTLREIRGIVEAHAYSSDVERLLAAIDSTLSPRRSVKLARVRRVAKEKTKREAWTDIRAAVLMRAGGVCENCGLRSEFLDADHFLGRGGGRKTLESVFTVWALCSLVCHREKTFNRPSSKYWLERFIEHCEKQCKFGCRGVSCDGFAHAAGIAQKRLDSLRTQAEMAVPR